MAKTATILPNPASRVWRGRCGRRSRSIRAPPVRCRPPRDSLAADRNGHCEEQLRPSNPILPCGPPGWLRFARNDDMVWRGLMPVYTVHAPVDAGVEAQHAADRFVFVRDGFHFWAFLLGPLWLAWNRLWLALIGYILMIAAVEGALSQLRMPAGARFALMLLVALLVGLQGPH